MSLNRLLILQGNLIRLPLLRFISTTPCCPNDSYLSVASLFFKTSIDCICLGLIYLSKAEIATVSLKFPSSGICNLLPPAVITNSGEFRQVNLCEFGPSILTLVYLVESASCPLQKLQLNRMNKIVMFNIRLDILIILIFRTIC